MYYLIIIQILFVLLFYPNSILGQNIGQEIALCTYKEIISFQSEKKLSPHIVIDMYPIPVDFIDDSMNDYWTSISKKCSNCFLEGLSESKKVGQIDYFAEEYVALFGKDKNALQDIRWAMGCPILATNSDFLIRPFAKNLNLSDDFQKFAISYNKSIVKNCQSSKEFYKRIFWFTLWAGERPFMHENKLQSSDDLIEYGNLLMEECIKEKWDENNYKYWFLVRNYIMLAYLCGFEEQIINYQEPLTPNNFFQLQQKLKKYFVLQTSHLIFDTKQIQYIVVPYPRFLTIELPNRPFSEIDYSIQQGQPNYFPRISRKLFLISFNEDFIKKILVPSKRLF
jgi:hypothetical protein